ncbi:hypothetical protein BDR04DRAFT_1094809, partial [Suillus decipiens]
SFSHCPVRWYVSTSHVLCGTYFLSSRKLKWESYIVVVKRGEQRLEASGMVSRLKSDMRTLRTRS